MEKAKSQVKALEGTVKKLHRDAVTAAKASSRHGTERQELETSTISAEAELADTKKRVSSLSDTLAKTQAELKRLQGYSKQLEATQRLKDAQVTYQYSSFEHSPAAHRSHVSDALTVINA
jgi:chromosome segregation ATPase